MSVESVENIQELLAKALNDINSSKDSKKLELLRIKYLGKQGFVTQKLKKIGSLPVDQRRHYGSVVNSAKATIEESIERKKNEISESEVDADNRLDSIDTSLPGRNSETGSIHPINKTLRRLTKIFEHCGFQVALGPEIEDDYHNFEALNIPTNHPARAMHDTFYLESGEVLRTHTSPVQVRYLESNKPPIQIIAPGKVYRCDSDVTHTPMFHQLEGLVVDEDVSFADLKGILIYFLREFFEIELPVRFRPSYFPFTEPSAEVDMGCVFCNSDGCRICKDTGWLEVLGCGMVHPEVFRHTGIDEEIYSGYAFGLGIERLTMLRYGVDDIRIFFENNIPFLSQFR